jgi:hypothetical protein
MRSKRLRIVGLVAAAMIAGYLIGPPVVEAATSLVTIQGAGSNHKARVSSAGRLLIDSEANVVAGRLLVDTGLGGSIHVLASGLEDKTVGVNGVITGVLAVRMGGSGLTTITDADGNLVWHSGTELQRAFEMISPGVAFRAPLIIDVPDGNQVRYTIYGYSSA